MKHLSLKHTHEPGPHRGGPHGPPKWPSQGLPRAGSAPLGGLTPPSSGLRLARGSTPPSSRLRLARGPLASTPAPAREYGYLCSDTAEPCHHAPGNHTPALFCQLPRREPIPATVGDCATWPVSAPWHCAAYSHTANVLRPRRGAGHTLEPLSRESAGASHDVRPAECHPRHCWSCAAAPVLAAPRRALLQPLRCCQARRDGTPPRLPLYPVRIAVNGFLEPV
jgi:hypothetical protein